MTQKEAIEWIVSYSLMESAFNNRVDFKQESFSSKEKAEARADSLRSLAKLRIRDMDYTNVSVKSQAKSL